jgi:hypothetical protein
VDQQSVLTRYRHLRAIGNQIQDAAFSRTTAACILDVAKRLGLTVGRTVICDSGEEMAMICDLAVYGRKPGRSSAIDRYARTAAFAPGSDEACMMEAQRQARFSIWCVGRRHDTAGVVVTDVTDKTEWWLMDEALAGSVDPGFAFAARLFRPADFAMTSGAIVPFDSGVLKEAFSIMVAPRASSPADVIADPRFAVAFYRAAINAGLMETVRFRDPVDPALAA